VDQLPDMQLGKLFSH